MQDSKLSTHPHGISLSYQAKHKDPPKPRCQPMLIPNGQSGQSSRSIKDRTKSPRLNGADLYVTRLGWQTADVSGTCCEAKESSTNQVAPPQPVTGSLYEELTQTTTKRTAGVTSSNPLRERQPSVLASRPCYRCISYMASVGIKRVFWTTNSGTWEGAKVRDLVDALDRLGTEPLVDATTALNSVFVTKHEVLMLRRMMGSS
jgi:hypothetical protein